MNYENAAMTPCYTEKKDCFNIPKRLNGVISCLIARQNIARFMDHDALCHNICIMNYEHVLLQHCCNCFSNLKQMIFRSYGYHSFLEVRD